MGRTLVLLCLLVLSVLASAKEYILEDLIAEEDNRRVIHNIGDDGNQARARKVTRQSSLEDTIRTVQEPITGPGYKQEPNQASRVKDKGGGSKEKPQSDDDKKTLSQQVASGMYALLPSEIFKEKPKRPGIISYAANPEVPKDNINNLGGLEPEEIWLAENHLLILAGGGFKNKNNDDTLWEPIDNYIAPKRQVKIPPNPKVPPPFPVQLKPGGPVEFIKGENGSQGPPPFFPPPGANFPLPPNASFPYPPAGFSPGNFSLGNGPYPPPPPFPFFPPPNGSFFLPPPGFLPPIPPGAAFLPPPGNLTDTFDEDDPSIYYPPPYDFYYPKDNSSLVAPGPLVPGIVLPPPPDFFAPFKNTTSKPSTPKSSRPVGRLPSKDKTRTRKPIKPKNVEIITSTEEPNNVITIRPSIGKVNINTTPRPGVYKTTAPPIPTFTRRPTIKTTTDNSLNEVSPPTIVHALPPNAVVKGWVPIPAPLPYYITNPKKTLRKGTTTLPPDYNSVTLPQSHGYSFNSPNFELSVNKWLYPNKSKSYEQEQQYFKVITDPPKQDFYYDDYYLNKNHYYSSTESPIDFEDQTKLKSIFYPTTAPVSTISPAQLYKSHSDNRGKALKTYFFYEEPHISEAKLTDTENLPFPTASPQQLKSRNPHTITEEIFINTAAKQSPHDQFKPSPLDYFYPSDGFVNIGAQKASTESPVQYYFIPDRPKSYRSHPYPPPITSTPRPYVTTKPPVYEYSFAIPGYGSVNPPKVGMTKGQEYGLPNHNLRSNPKPYSEPFYTTPAPTTTPTPAHKNQQHGESQYYTTKRPKSVYFTTQRPSYKEAIQTENPYHAFFTHHDAGLIDGITKKYFTTFGQKLNQDSIRGETVTTPLPPSVEDTSGKSYYPQTSPRPQYYESDRPRTRYSQNSAHVVAPVYYSTPAPSVNNYPPRLQYPQNFYSQLYDQRPYSSLVSTQKPVSLESDLLVNYKEPLRPINPDAEFIDPSNPSVVKPDQSFISYRLPGNGGGHFFFLTPQVAQQRTQFSEYMYGAEHPGQYYKRSTPRPRTQHRQVSSRVS